MGLIKRVLFNDGEGLVHGDLNNAQLYLREWLNYYWLKGLCQDSQDYAGGLSNAKAYAHGRSGSVVSIEALKTRTYSGVLFYYDSSLLDLLMFYDAGGTGGAFAHTFSTDGLTAGQSRWDVCCYKIEEVDDDSQTRDVKDPDTGVIGAQTVYKQKTTSALVDFVAGTPDLTADAVEPAVTAGYAKLYAVRVDYGQTLAFQYDQMRDYRYPLGYREQSVRPSEMWLSGAGGWVYNGDADILYADGGADDIYIPYRGSSASRILELMVSGMPGAACTAKLGYLTKSSSTTRTFTEIVDSITAFQGGTSSERYYRVADNLALWGSGRQVPYITHSAMPVLCAKIYSADAGGYIHQAKWCYGGF